MPSRRSASRVGAIPMFWEVFPPGIWHDVVSCLSAQSLCNEGDWDSSWLEGLMDESPRDVSLHVGCQGTCRWCQETLCFARKHLPIFLMQLPNLCCECAWVDGESIANWRLRCIRKRLCQLMRQVEPHDPFLRDPTVAGLWDIAPEGWMNVPHCLKGLIQMLIVGDHRN